MKKSTMCRFGGLLLLLHGFAAAQEAADLYTAEARLADESSETRNATLSGLLEGVLVRVSGNTGIAGMPAARDLLDSAPSLVQQYRYRTAEADGVVSRYLWARFDQPVIERMMRERGLPVWTQRPRVLLWVGTEQGGRRSLLNLELEPQARAAILERARQRGIPLQLPLLDLEDQAALTTADLWSGYQAGIRRASVRYPHQAILVGRLSARGVDRWQGGWLLIDGDTSQEFQSPVLALSNAVVFALDQAQNLLAARYAPLPGTGGPGGTLVGFSDIRDLAAYGRVLALLDTIEPVSQVALRYVEGDRFVFELQLRGDVHDLSRALEASGQLLAESAPGLRMTVAPAAATGGQATSAGIATSAPPPEADLYYRLLH